MFNIAIRRSHRLSLDQATTVAATVASELQAKYGIESQWQNSALHFTGHGVSGTLSLSPGLLSLDVKLGFLMAPFRHSISAAIERKLDKELLAVPAAAEGDR